MSKDLAMKENEIALNNIQWDLHEVEESKPLEFTKENNAELFGIEPIKANEMVSDLQITLSERKILKDAYLDVISLQITTENLPTFKELRLKIVKNRTSINKWHTLNKAFYLAGGRFVDAIKNKEILENQEMESKLMNAEKFFENQEKEKALLLNNQRLERISFYVEDTTGIDFSAMTDEDFDDYLLGKKTRFENEIEAKKKEETRIATELLEELERQRLAEIENEKIRKENADLKAKSEARELELTKEREKEQAERKIESDKQVAIQLKKDAELKAINDELEAARENARVTESNRLAKEDLDKAEALKLAKAPIKKQLLLWVENFEISTPITQNEKSLLIEQKFNAFKNWAKNEIESI